MIRDGVATQELHGVAPTPREVEELAVAILERTDAQKRDEKPPAPISGTKKPGALEREFEKRGGTPGTFGAWNVERKPIAPGEIRSKKLTLDAGSMLVRKRIRLLRSKPEWAARLATINPLAANGSLGPVKREEAERAYWAIIKDSCRLFGPVFKGKARKLWFH